MCGIVGYIGEKNAHEIILEGLKKLEYRGYDSAGIAIITGNEITLKRSTGKLVNLEKLINKESYNSKTGIGHTRWATHGRPSEENAHPHMDCTSHIVLVHNGIIENYKKIRDDLVKKNHIFDSETDTEVIVHLLEEESKTRSFQDAFITTLKKLEGSYAIACLSSMDEEKVFFAKNGSPLILGVGSGENIIASDIPAVLSITNKIIILEDGEAGYISKNKIEVSDLTGNIIDKKITIIDWSPVTAERGGYKHFMLKEIFEEPDVIVDTIRGRLSNETDEIILEDLNLSEEQIKKIKRIHITACGTSYYAGMVGKYFFEKITNIPVDIDISSEMRYRDVKVDKDDILVAISQSGETKDTICTIEEIRKKNIKIISICNVQGSTVSRKSDGIVYTRCGPEIGVASTKAFVGQIIALYLMGLYFAKIRKTISNEDYNNLINEIRLVPSKIRKILKMDNDIHQWAKKYFKKNNFLYLGRDINFPIALEGALKLKEISYIHAEGYAAGEMKHGPIALIDENMPVLVIATNSFIYQKIYSNIIEAKSRGGIILSIASDGNKDLVSISDDIFYVPVTNELISPLVNIIPLQLLAYHVAVLKGCDVDQPRNLAKSVTVE